MSRTRIIFFSILGITAVIISFSFFTSGRREPVAGLVGSEKIPFFSDERVPDALRSHGLDVSAQKAGSREIATSDDLNQYDFVFPAGVLAAEKIQREHNISQSYDPFFTPMALASWQPIADLLVQEGIAAGRGGYYTVVMDRLMALMADLFLRQGLRPSSSQEPFEDYLVRGMGHSPIVIIYEAQFIAQAAQNSATILPEMVLMYPEPTIFTKHVLIPITADYPPVLLNEAKREQYDRLATFLCTPEFQQTLMETTLRRPVVPRVALDGRIPDPLLVELPFPNTVEAINSLLFSYLDEQRVPAHAFFVLDVSGSMRGEGISDVLSFIFKQIRGYQ